MNLKTIHRVYFLGIGGIGMSALVRYFLLLGKQVAGYDRTPTSLTEVLAAEGAAIHYSDKLEHIPETFRHTANTLVIYTPAIPANSAELAYFTENSFSPIKRAEILGKIAANYKTIAVAGTHGKTSVSTLTAHLMHNSELGCTAFLGGISKNYNSNFLSSESEFMVAEADEYDRSFLQLYPFAAVITSTDADHLDIYGTADELLRTFAQFTNNIQAGGYLLHKPYAQLTQRTDITVYTYSVSENTDFRAENISKGSFGQTFDFVSPFGKIANCSIQAFGLINIENAVAALALNLICGGNTENLKVSLAAYQGVVRRFDIRVKTNSILYIDDYAHHPTEIAATLNTIRRNFPERKITVIFQPHLFSRTRDFAQGFGQSLSIANRVILTDIYPAREEPIAGVSSQIIYQHINTHKILTSKENALELIIKSETDILVTMGAGDVSNLVEPLTKLLS